MSNPESSQSSLPESWVRKVFATMRATYGAAFDRQWQCPAGMDPAEHAAEMIGHWGRELRGYQQSPKAIAYALDHLPSNPPNLIEFKALCRGAPQYVEAPKLEAPSTPPPPHMAEAVAGIVAAKPDDPKQWAHDLKARERRDPRCLTASQRWMWREALGDGGRAS